MKLSQVGKNLRIALLCFPVLSQAGTMENTANSNRFYFTGLSGLSVVRGNDNHSFMVDEQYFIYRSNYSNKLAKTLGGQLGIEFPAYKNKLLIQTGVNYTYVTGGRIEGKHSVGMEPITYTDYSYQYNLNAQQILAVVKIIRGTSLVYRPYLFAGVGKSFNKTSSFKTATAHSGTVNLTPGFSNELKSSFSYSIGIGVDKTVSDNLRVGLGYIFSDLGKTSTGHGAIALNSLNLPVPFSLSRNHNYLNQIAVQVTYLT